MLLKLKRDRGLKIPLIYKVHVSLHQRPDGLIHGFLAHLERITNFDLLHASKWILLCNRLIWIQSRRLVIILRLLEALIAAT